MQTAPSKGLTPSPPETPLGHVDMLADICPGTSCRQGPASAHQSCDCHSCARQPPTASSAGLAAGKAIYQQLWSRSFGSNEGLDEMQDLQQQQQAISSSSQGLLIQKKGLVEKEEVLTDHEAAADMRRHSSCEEQVQQPAEGQSAESIR